jgi:hypothetical protein
VRGGDDRAGWIARSQGVRATSGHGSHQVRPVAHVTR